LRRTGEKTGMSSMFEWWTSIADGAGSSAFLGRVFDRERPGGDGPASVEGCMVYSSGARK
jgi:hypothetical protein